MNVSIDKQGPGLAPLLLYAAVSCPAVIFLTASRPYDAREAVSVLLVTMMALIVIGEVIGYRGELIALDLRSPEVLYGTFYALYYFCPFVLFVLSERTPKQHVLYIALLIFLGYVGFRGGSVVGGRSSNATTRLTMNLDPRCARALLRSCYVGLVFVLAHYAWRIQNGAYYTHAGYFAQAPTVSAAIFYSFFSRFELPLVLLSGCLQGVSDRATAQAARRFFRGYLVLLIAVYVTSSQFRPALTCVMFAVVVMRMNGTLVIRLKHVLALVALGLLMLLGIQGVRFVVAERGMAGEGETGQLTQSLGYTSEAASTALARYVEMLDAIELRTVWPLTWVSNIIDASDSGRNLLGAAPLMEGVYALIPRPLWPDKPIVISQQILIARGLNMPEIDASGGPIGEMYPAFGTIGTVLAMFLFGAGLKALTKRASVSRSPFLWLMLFSIWSGAAQAETGLVLVCLTFLRHACACYIIYRVMLLFNAGYGAGIGLARTTQVVLRRRSAPDARRLTGLP